VDIYLQNKKNDNLLYLDDNNNRKMELLGEKNEQKNVCNSFYISKIF
jgi:hypothetical protein